MKCFNFIGTCQFDLVIIGWFFIALVPNASSLTEKFEARRAYLDLPLQHLQCSSFSHDLPFDLEYNFFWGIKFSLIESINCCINSFLRCLEGEFTAKET